VPVVRAEVCLHEVKGTEKKPGQASVDIRVEGSDLLHNAACARSRNGRRIQSQQALKFFVSSTSVRDRELIEELQSEGHHGNPITILSLQIKRTADCLCFASFVREHFLKEDLARLREEMPERLGNDQVFHLRFDKQAAYLQR